MLGWLPCGLDLLSTKIWFSAVLAPLSTRFRRLLQPEKVWWRLPVRELKKHKNFKRYLLLRCKWFALSEKVGVDISRKAGVEFSVLRRRRRAATSTIRCKWVNKSRWIFPLFSSWFSGEVVFELICRRSCFRADLQEKPGRPPVKPGYRLSPVRNIRLQLEFTEIHRATMPPQRELHLFPPIHSKKLWHYLEKNCALLWPNLSGISAFKFTADPPSKDPSPSNLVPPHICSLSGMSTIGNFLIYLLAK